MKHRNSREDSWIEDSDMPLCDMKNSQFMSREDFLERAANADKILETCRRILKGA
jgi:hypothetical protein